MSSLNTNLCVSPVEEGKRCKERNIGESFFCKVHADLYHNDYLRYKKLEESIKFVTKKKPLNKMSVKELLMCYSRLYKAYDLRNEYREKAFIKEAWDEGHDFYIKILWSWIYRYYNELVQRFKQEKEKEEELSEDESESESEDDEEMCQKLPVKIERRLKNLERKMKRIEKNEQTWKTEIPQAIAENRKQIEKYINYFDNIFKSALNIGVEGTYFYESIYMYLKIADLNSQISFKSIAYTKVELDYLFYNIDGIKSVVQYNGNKKDMNMDLLHITMPHEVTELSFDMIKRTLPLNNEAFALILSYLSAIIAFTPKLTVRLMKFTCTHFLYVFINDDMVTAKAEMMMSSVDINKSKNFPEDLKEEYQKMKEADGKSPGVIEFIHLEKLNICKCNECISIKNFWKEKQYMLPEYLLKYL